MFVTHRRLVVIEKRNPTRTSSETDEWPVRADLISLLELLLFNISSNDNGLFPRICILFLPCLLPAECWQSRHNLQLADRQQYISQYISQVIYLLYRSRCSTFYLFLWHTWRSPEIVCHISISYVRSHGMYDNRFVIISSERKSGQLRYRKCGRHVGGSCTALFRYVKAHFFQVFITWPFVVIACQSIFSTAFIN